MGTLTIRIDNDIKKCADDICQRYHTTLNAQIVLHLKDLIDNGKPLYPPQPCDIHHETAIVALWLLLAPLREHYMQINLDIYAGIPVASEAFAQADSASMEFTVCFPKIRVQVPVSSWPIWDALNLAVVQLRTTSAQITPSEDINWLNPRAIPQVSGLSLVQRERFLKDCREFERQVLLLPRPQGHPLENDTCRSLITVLIDAGVIMNSAELFYRLLCQRVSHDGLTAHEAFIDVIDHLPALSLRLLPATVLDRLALQAALVDAGFSPSEVGKVLSVVLAQKT
ncbi:hypothetical protein SJI19_06125 [Acerihabitans sp. TG2]|uniref:hypothetical protein n=1 Tax=Acerihabitans sp. TG2 TaxID=3096008 RepID=UPI002B2319D1|nr:hypothetical protein [Acerihabitans sp. TG2]MEA9390130.1 hypothetical protein [Acerihabitans sp. TG2]